MVKLSETALLNSRERAKVSVLCADEERYGSTKESRLARRKAQTRLGTETSGMETKRDSRSAGSDGGSSQPMDQARKRRGEEALKASPSPGVKPRLSAQQKAQLPALLAKGAAAYGFRGEVWTASRVAAVIEQCFGVRYSRDHAGAIMRKMGWSPQKPEEKASQRDEEAIAAWKTERWEALKKSSRGNANHRLGG